MINIQEQFQVNIGLPIDARIVASGSTERNAIQYKYDGLLVYDTNDRKTYAWNDNTSQWTQADLNGVGQPNYVTKWSSSGLTQSPIYTTGVTTGKIGINTNDPKGWLQINPEAGSSDPYIIYGDFFARNWYNDGSDQYINYTSGSAGLKFTINGEILLYLRPSSSPALNSADNSVNELVKFSHTFTKFKKDVYIWGSSSDLPSNGQYTLFLRASTGTSNASSPDVTWYNDDGTGLYHPANNRIGISIAGVQKAIFSNNGLLLSSTGNIPQPNHRLQIDSGNATQNYLQFTNGTTTDTVSANGFLVGINNKGWPIIKSGTNKDYPTSNQKQAAPIFFNFENGTYQYFKRNKITAVASTSGASVAQLSQTNGGSFGRVETISIEKDLFNNTNNTVYELEVSSSMWVSIDVTFTTYVKYSGSSYQVRSNKVFKIMKSDSDGYISTQATQTSPADIFTSGATSKFNAGTVDIGVINNRISFKQQVLNVPGFQEAKTVANIVVIFNSFAPPPGGT